MLGSRAVSRFGTWIGTAFGAGGCIAFSLVAFVATPAQAESTADEESPPPIVADAGSEQAPDASCPDGGCDDAGVAKAKPPADDSEEPTEEKSPPEPRPTRVSLDSIAFKNGEVPRAQRALERLAAKELSTCATENGGVAGQGTVELKFLVRARGRAEGVDLGRTRNVPPEVAKCLAFTLARRPVGAPSDEPVFVTARFKLVEDKAAAKPKRRGN